MCVGLRTLVVVIALVGVYAASGEQVTLRILSTRRRRVCVDERTAQEHSVLHINATPAATEPLLPEVSASDRLVCLRVNGSSRGCFDGSNPRGGLLPITRGGMAWVTSHMVSASGKPTASTPLAVLVPDPVSIVFGSRDDDHSAGARACGTFRAALSQESCGGGGEADANAPACVVDHDDAVAWSADQAKGVSAVLVVRKADADRATLLMRTLETCCTQDVFRELFVVVPAKDLPRMQAAFSRTGEGSVSPSSRDWTKAVSVVDEQLLLPDGVSVDSRWDKYALQMMLKLLASKLVGTEYYLTLDADILCTASRLTEDDLLPGSKGNYVPEGRHVHASWWAGSGRALQVENREQDGGFGVTPAVLSAAGSMLTLERLREVHGGEADFVPRMMEAFAAGPDTWWSEYTLYRMALDFFGAFDVLHAVGSAGLIGKSVWFPGDIDAWNATEVFENDSTLFSVVQSTAGVDTDHLARIVSRALELRS